MAGNAASLVLAVSGGGRRLLFTGDLAAATERALVARDGARLGCDVLKVPHHGSAGSTSPELARATAPALAVISAGVRDSYGHPAAAVCARLAGSGARVLRTDRDGAVTLSWRAHGPWRLRLPGAPRRLRDDG